MDGASYACVCACCMQECLTQDGVRVNCVCPEFTDTSMVTQLPDIAPHTWQLVSSVGLLQ